MPSILITGANRGIGLELARQYAQAGWRLFATCRHPVSAAELQHLAAHMDNVSVHRLDVTLSEDIYALAWEIKNIPIDLLVNNAGVYLEPDYLAPELGAVRYSEWLRSFEVNTLGAFRVTEKLLPNVKSSEKRLVVALTSHMASIADIHAPGSYYYRSSKAALNAAMQGLAQALRPDGVGVLLLHPGGVNTRMGSPEGITTEKSVNGMRRIIDEFDIKDTGLFIKYDGTPMPW